MRDNYYILLELDPSISDDAIIQNAIISKQQQWARERNHPTLGPYAQKCLDEIPKIRILMADTTARMEEAKNAVQILKEKKEKRYDDLITAGSILVKNGEILQNDLANLLKKKFKDFSEPEALKILNARIKKDAIEFQDDGIVELDSSIMNLIRTNLTIVHKKNLFDFLEMSPTSLCTSLQKKADQLYTEYSRNANKTAVVTAGMALASICRENFKDENTKLQYQKSLERESFNTIIELIDIAAGDKIIDVQEFEKIIEHCSKTGIEIARAEYYIEQYCKKKSFTLIKTETPEYRKQIQCKVCYHLNDRSSNNCSNCSNPLSITCPKCSNNIPSFSNACPKCGFITRDMPNAIFMTKQAKIEFSKGNINQAEKLLKQALAFWPGYPDAVLFTDNLAAEQVLVNKSKKEIDTLYQQKKFIALKSKLKELSRDKHNDDYIFQYKVICDKNIKRAKDICDIAEHEHDKEKKLYLYLSALDVCADFDDAVIGSSSMPVERPTELQITVQSKTIAMKWGRPHNNKAIKYLVIRKLNGRPSNNTDGTVLAETSNTYFDDNTPEIGKSYYYAVYSVRGNRFSNEASVHGPVLITENVQNIKAISSDARVELSWNTAKNYKKIEIYRSDQKSSGTPGIDQLLTQTSSSSFIDTQLTNDRTYRYSVYCIYEDCLGQYHKSEGVTITATPSTPPMPIADLEYTISGKRVNLNWTPPSKGYVQIIQCYRLNNISPGTILSSVQIDELGETIPLTSSTYAHLDMNGQGEFNLLPLVIFNNNAIVGKAITITNLEDIRNLKGMISAGKIYLEWDWPPQSSLVEIRYSHVGFSKNDPTINDTIVKVTKEQYDQNNAFVIGQPVAQDYYFTVYNCSEKGSKMLLSNGVSEILVNSKVSTISYKVITRKFLKKEALIELTSTSEILIPEIKVIVKHGGIPLNMKDGTCILTLAPRLISKKHKVDISRELLSRDSFIKLFFTDEKNNKRIKLLMPSREKLELY